jgi:protein-tyrosine phosphatase
MFENLSADPIMELPFGLKGRVFRGRMPYSLFDLRGAVIAAAARAGVDVVVLLAEDDECLLRTDHDLAALYKERGWSVLKMPIADQGVPAEASVELFRSCVFEARACADGGRNVLVHCLAGVGRTGLFLACLARVVLGLEPEAAIDWVRKYVPGAVEVEEQRRFVGTVVL